MPNTFSEEEIHLTDYLRVILKRRWMIVSILVILVTTVAISSFTAVPIYKATAQILIEREDPNVVNIEEVVGVNATDRDYYQTQYEILKSRSLALKVITAINLKESPEFAPGRKGFSLKSLMSSIINWIKGVTFSAKGSKKGSFNPDSEYNNLIKAYLGRLQVDPLRNSRLVNVSFEGKNPRIVAQIANTHAQLYIESNIERKFSASKDAVNWLNQRIKEIRKKLEQSELALQKYREKKGLASIDFEERQGIILQSLNDLNSALTLARTQRMEKGNLFSELKKLSSRSPEMIESMPSVVSNALIQNLKARYVELSGEYYNLSRKYGHEHPKIVGLVSEINSVKKKISQEIKNIARSIETEYRVALAKEKSIFAAMEEQKKEALELNQKQIQYNVLKRTLDVNRSLYESLLRRVKEASLTKGLGITNIMVVDRARIPNGPVKPKKKLNILLSIIAGLTLGVGLAFFFEYLDNTIKSPEDIERYLKIPVLGVVGRFKQIPKNSGGNSDLVTSLDPKSNISEALRAVRTNLLFFSPDTEKRGMLVASAFPSEGKTFISANLAISFAQMGKKVLLVDSDLRRPRIHSLFNLKKSPGLSELLVGKKASVKDSEIPGLKIITCGTIPPNPAELLASNRMKELIEKIRRDFDIILFDSPPLLSVADASGLATILSGVILAIKAGSTPKPAIQRATKQLSDIGARVFGCVLNNVNFEKESYYYSQYQYYYNYYYGEDAGKGSKKGRRRKM